MKTFLVKFERWWLLFLLFAIPLSLKYITKDPYAISWLNVLSVGFIGLGVINALTGEVPFQKIPHKPFVVLIACFFLAMAWALLFTHPLRNGIGLWTSRLTQPALVGYFAYLLAVNKKVTVQQCVQALFWSLIPLLILGVMQYIGVIPYRDPGRITTTYFYPNTFARYMDILLLVTLPWILFSVKKYKAWYLGVWILSIALLLSSKSYNGTVSFAVGLLAILIALPKPFNTMKKILIGIIVVIGVLVVANAKYLPKYQTSITDSRFTRLEFWQVAEGVIQDHFWTGIGIKTWETTYPQLVEKYYIEKFHKLPLNWGSVQPHDVFLDSFVKAGLPGFIAITAILLWPIFEGFAWSRSYDDKHPYWWFGLSLLGYGVAMFVFGFIDDPIWSDDTVPILFTLYFLLAAVIVLHRHQKRLPKNQDS